MAFVEAIGEAAGGGAVGGIHDGVKGALDLGLVGLAGLVEDVPDLVRPATLDGDAGEDRWQGGQQARTAIDEIMSRPVPVSPRR
jgi:hypothetical protein